MNYNIYSTGQKFSFTKASYESSTLTKYAWTTNFTALGYRGSAIPSSSSYPYLITAKSVPEYYLAFPTPYECPPEVIIFDTNKDSGISISSTEWYYRWPLKITKVTNEGVYITDTAYTGASTDIDWSANGIIYLRVRARTILHDSIDPDGPKVSNPELSLNFGEAGELKFELYPGDVGYDDVSPYKTHIMVDRNDKPFWYGRVSNIETAFDLKKSVTCEGELNFLKDVAVGWGTIRTWFNGDDDNGVFTTYDAIFAWAIISYLEGAITSPENAGSSGSFTDELRVIFDLPARGLLGSSTITPYPIGDNRTTANRKAFVTDDIDIMDNISEGEGYWTTYGPGVYVKYDDVNYDDKPYDILETYFTDVFNGYLYSEIDDRGFHRIKFTINPIATGSQTIEYGENMTDITVKTDVSNMRNIWTPYAENSSGDNVWLGGTLDPTQSGWDPKSWNYSIYDSTDKYWEYQFAGGNYELKYLYGQYGIYNPDSIANYGPLYSSEELDMQTYSVSNQAVLAQSIRALNIRSRLPLGLSVTAVDRAEYDDSQEPLDLGYEYRIISRPHDVDAQLILTEATLHLDSPRESEFGFGDLDTSASGYMAKRYGVGTNYSKQITSDSWKAIADTNVIDTQSGTVFIDDPSSYGTVIVVFPKEFWLDPSDSNSAVNVHLVALETIPGLTLTVKSTSANQFKMGYASTQSVRSFHVYWEATTGITGSGTVSGGSGTTTVS